MDNRTLYILGGVAIATSIYLKLQSDRLHQLEAEHAQEQNQISLLKSSLESNKRTQTQQASDALATEVDNLHRLQDSLKIQQAALDALQKERQELNTSSTLSLDEARALLKAKNDSVRDLEARLKTNHGIQSQMGQHNKLVYANESEDKKERHQQRKAQIEWHVQAIRAANNQMTALIRQKYTYDRQMQINNLKDQIPHLQTELAQLHQDEAEDDQTYSYQKASYEGQYQGSLAQLKTEEGSLNKQLQEAKAARDAIDHNLHDTANSRKYRIQQIDIKSANIRAILQTLRTQIDVQLARCVELGYKI